jgi:phospholipase/carboxylesterase
VTLEYIERVWRSNPRLSIVWLHGLGADGRDFEPIVDELGLEFGARFIFPHAPVRPVTLNGGVRMRAWFDLVGLHPGFGWDRAGIDASTAAVMDLVEREVERGMPAERIVLAGFSQGGALALHAGLRAPQRLAGILAMSAFLPLAETLSRETSPANAATPIMMAHGDSDAVVSPHWAESSARFLVAGGYRVDWRVYAMAHAVCAAEIADIAAWLADRAEAQ